MSARPASPDKFLRSRCPVAVALDTLGDTWSLVILRDMFVGKRRFSEFLASPEGIKRNILAERLKRLELAGIIRKIPYQQRPERFEYLPTRVGTELLPVLQAIARWAAKNIDGVWQPSNEFYAWRPEQFLVDQTADHDSAVIAE